MAPQFTIFATVDMSRTIELRARLQESGTPATYNDIFIRAVALALASIPTMNARYEHARIVPQEHIDIGVVIATKGAQTFGSVQDAESLSLGEISRQTQRLGHAAWDGTAPDAAETRPAAFTVSNLGMYGVSKFAGYVVPCQAGLLSVGAIEQQPVCTGSSGVQVRPVVELGLTCDHRVVAAADAAFFSQLLGELLTDDIEALGAA
ncbi:2-oxo acid dehydrogenase subunit E2 [Aeromicrobium wangtongii]|uniref:2-oxo acid dehydrogenase subunit E2 n=1 Tax=Aeromicrobium wangtongii TaxID=2969247 RepID=UPI002017DA84|nr:2-oxo acid dehydrogenase subunit E2 [Aeromicrobium wangtongii]MCL3816951.1 2-oxo acid dehydrogenase subunit E2 [Aeromicrobium wangtongii]